MSRNIEYSTDKIKEYFKLNRIEWDALYPSEQKVINFINPTKKHTVLDIGCGCGGLGLILKKRFGLKNYTGVEINKQAAAEVIKLNKEAVIINNDFILHDFNKKTYDFVFSLSCIDWNIEFEKMLLKSWQLVSNEGQLILSLRLTNKKELIDINNSYQFINYEGKKTGEKAPYIILNYDSFKSKLYDFDGISSVYGYGYNGNPSKTAVTKYSEICFAVFAIKKDTSHSNSKKRKINFKLDIPL